MNHEKFDYNVEIQRIHRTLPKHKSLQNDVWSNRGGSAPAPMMPAALGAPAPMKPAASILHPAATV